MIEKYNTKIIRYPDGSVEVIKHGKTKTRLLGEDSISNKLKRLNPNDDEDELMQLTLDQAYRIKRKIKYYIASNDFDLFWTLTFNDAKVNAKDYAYARKRLSAWLKYQREKFGRFGYLFIPELHKSGRIHFHGVTANFKPPLGEARSPKTNRLIKKNGIQIYNAQNWQDGFSTVSHIENKAKTSVYVSKYISKDLVELPSAYNQPRYFVSRGLQQPDISYENWNEEQLQPFKPSFVIGNISTETTNFEASVSIYHLNTSDGQFSQPELPETVYKSNN